MIFSGTVAMGFFFIWGIIVNLSIIFNSFGIFGLITGLIFAPVIFALAPFYALLFMNDFIPVFICYGGGSLSFLLIACGYLLKNKSKP